MRADLAYTLASMGSTLTTTCEQCGKELRYTEAMAGKRGKCKCGAPITLPSVEPAMASTAVPEFAIETADLMVANAEREVAQEMTAPVWAKDKPQRSAPHGFTALNAVAGVLRFGAALSIASAIVMLVCMAVLPKYAGVLLVTAAGLGASALWSFASAELILLVIGVALDLRSLRERAIAIERMLVTSNDRDERRV
jgi:hypothetical protein